MWVGRGDETLQAIHGYFSEVCGLELHTDCERGTLPSLEACLSLCQDTCKMGVRLKRRVEEPTDVCRNLMR